MYSIKSIKLWRWLVFSAALIFLASFLTLLGCDSVGGGGNDDVEEDEIFEGGGGTGAENAVTFWRYYGPLDMSEVGDNQSVIVSEDGGFIACGWKGTDFAFENRDYFILKTDSQGNEQWRLTNPLPDQQNLKDIRQAADGGAIAVGFTGRDADRDILVVKTDKDGNLEWSHTYDAGRSEYDHGSGVAVIGNGYAVCGVANAHDYWFFKLDRDGNKITGSDRFFSFPGNSHTYAMEKTHDNGFVITGIAPPHSVAAVRVDEDGDEIWRGLYGTGIGYAVCQLPAPDNGFVVAGATPPYAETESDVIVIKIDDSGNEVWRKVFGGADMDIGYGVAASPAGECIVVSDSRSYTTQAQTTKNDFYMIKLDAGGKIIWQKVKGFSPYYAEAPYDIAMTPDGGFIITGHALSMNLLAKFDKNGDTIHLGDNDFTFTVTETTGLIHMGNARWVAEISGEFVSLPIEIGAFPLDLLLDTLAGMPVSDLCERGGQYAWNKPVTAPVAAGDEYIVTFSACESGPADDPATYNGTFTITVAAVSGDLATDNYDVRMVIDPIDFIFSDDVGEERYAGGLTYSRTSSDGGFIEQVATAGKNLTFTDDDGSAETLTQLDLSATRSETAGFSIGSPGQYAIFNTDQFTGPLKVSIETPISGLDIDEPESGKLRVEAQDGSSLTITFDQGTALIEVDTDGDGTIDGDLETDWVDVD